MDLVLEGVGFMILLWGKEAKLPTENLCGSSFKNLSDEQEYQDRPKVSAKKHGLNGTLYQNKRF